MHSHVSMDGAAIETQEDAISCRGPCWTGVGTVEAYAVLYKELLVGNDRIQNANVHVTSSLTAGRFLSLRNCEFLSAVGMQTAPRPAAVMEPSALMFPEAGADIVGVLTISARRTAGRGGK